MAHEEQDLFICHDFGWGVSLFLFLFFFLDLIDRLIDCTSGGRRRGTGRENLKQTPCWTWSPMRAQTHDPKIMTWAELKSQMVNWLSHPNTPVGVSLWTKLKGVNWELNFCYFLKATGSLSVIQKSGWRATQREDRRCGLWEKVGGYYFLYRLILKLSPFHLSLPIKSVWKCLPHDQAIGSQTFLRSCVAESERPRITSASPS